MRVFGFIVSVAVLSLFGCGEGREACGSGDVCAPAPFARAIIRGQVFEPLGETVPGLEVYANCGEAGIYNDVTDSQGRFLMAPAFSPADPPDSDEAFLVPCAFSAEGVTFVDDAWITFYPRPLDVEPVDVTFTYFTED